MASPRETPEIPRDFLEYGETQDRSPAPVRQLFGCQRIAPARPPARRSLAYYRFIVNKKWPWSVLYAAPQFVNRRPREYQSADISSLHVANVPPGSATPPIHP